MDPAAGAYLLGLAGLRSDQTRWFPHIIPTVHNCTEKKTRDTHIRTWWSTLRQCHPQLTKLPPNDVVKGLRDWDFTPDVEAKTANGWHTTMFLGISNVSLHEARKQREHIDAATQVTTAERRQLDRGTDQSGIKLTYEKTVLAIRMFCSLLEATFGPNCPIRQARMLVLQALQRTTQYAEDDDRFVNRIGSQLMTALLHMDQEFFTSVFMLSLIHI